MSAGSVTQFEFNPRWVRIEPGREPRQCVTVASGRVSVSVGRHLAFDRRAEFARVARVAQAVRVVRTPGQQGGRRV
ncbi:DUF2244 domain-containing protein [Mycetohabitans endofungorum]|uniref:DUF2244 domain-containing protein n=1 Tax=Mycetohabitans endofungorum TaxID=417203 RepID=UPI0030CADF57